MSRFVKMVLLGLVLCGPAIVPGVAQERGEDAGLVIEGIPEIPEPLAERLRPYQYLRTASFTGWHPSGEGILITKPLLVMQGQNDPRVPASEAEQIVEAVRKNGGEVWYLLATDEGHQFSKRQDAKVAHQAMALFLERFLLAEPAADPETAARR